MSKHTPGPWSVRKCGGGYAIDYNADQEQICDYVYELPDAHLIAAAPLLLQELKAARDFIDFCKFAVGGGVETLKGIDAAIAAAEGEA